MEEKGSLMSESEALTDAKGGGRVSSGAKNVRKSFYVLDEDQLTNEKKFSGTPPSSNLTSLNVSSDSTKNNGMLSLDKSPLPTVSENGDNVFSPISPAVSTPSMNSTNGSKASRRSSIAGESKTSREERYKRAIEDDPTDANALSKYGIFLKNVKNDNDGALNMYKRALDADPNHVTTLCRLGVLLQSVKKDYDGAERIYKRVLDIEPEHVGILYNYGCLLEDVRKDYVGAEKMYERVLEVDPDHISALRVYGRLLHQVKKDIDGAEEAYNNVLRLEPFDLSTLNRYGVLLHQDREDYDRAEECFKKVLSVDPDHFRTLGNYAVFLKNVRKNYDKADELYQRALAIDPTHVPTLNNYAVFIKQSRGATPVREYVASKIADSEEKEMQPEELYLSALEKDPSDENTHFNYAKWLRDVKKDNVGAIEHFLQSLRQPATKEQETSRPLAEIEREIEILNILGKLYQCEECLDLNEAEGCFQMALSVNRNHIDTLYNYAKFFEFRASTQFDDDVRASDFHEAESVFQNILQLDENHLDTLYSYGVLLEYFHHDYEKCEEMHKKILEINPNHVDTLLQYGIFLHEIRKDDEAAEEKYRYVLELDPNNVAATYNYACLLRDNDENDRAENLFKKALDINPDHVSTLGAYGAFLHDVKGHDVRAEELYLRALEVDPKHVPTLYNLAALLKDWATKDQSSSRYAFQSQRYYDKILSIDPDNINALVNYGVLLFSCHDILSFTYQHEAEDGELQTESIEGSGYMGAEICFKRVLELDPYNTRALFNYAGMLYSMLPKLGFHIEIPSLVRDTIIREGKAMAKKLVDMPDEDVSKTRRINSMRLLKSFELYEEKCNENSSIPNHIEDGDEMANLIMGLFTPVQDAESIKLRKSEREAKEAVAQATLLQAKLARISEESKKSSEEKAQKALKDRVKNALMRNILSAAEEQLSGAFNIWKMSVQEIKLEELQELMESKSHHLHEEESKHSPLFLAKAAFELSEKYRRKRDNVVPEVKKTIHHFGLHSEGKIRDDAMRLKYTIPNHFEGYEVYLDGTPSPVEKALVAARQAFEYSEDRRDERTLDEESLRKKKNDKLSLITHHVRSVCVENKTALTDEEQHWELCNSIKRDMKLDSEGEEVMYHALISFSPENPFSHALYGGYLYKKGLLKDAKEEFKQAIDVFEANGGIHADSHFYYGAILKVEKKIVEAETHFKTVLKLNPTHADCLCEYAILLLDYKNNLDMAEIRFKECLEVQPSHLKCLRNYARLMKNMDENLNPDKWIDTCDLLARVIAVSPNDTETLLQYALLVQKKLNMPDNAKRAYEMLLDLDPSNQEALIQYSFMLFKQLPPVSNKLELPKKIVDVTEQIKSQLTILRTIDNVKEEYIHTAHAIEEKLEQYDSNINTSQKNGRFDEDATCFCSIC